MPNQPTFGVPYHSQHRRDDGVWVSICPFCRAEYPMDRKDWESHTLSSAALAHLRSKHSK